MQKESLPRSVSGLRQIWRHGDAAWNGIVVAMAVFVLMIMVAIGWSVWSASGASRAEFGWNFLAPTDSSSWDPVNDAFQAWPIITGTLSTAIIAILIATPVSVAIAEFWAVAPPTNSANSDNKRRVDQPDGLWKCPAWPNR